MAHTKTLDALFPGVRRSILCALFGEPARWWSLNELAGRAGINPSSLRHHLADLCDAGVVRQHAESVRPSFQPDPECPVYLELRALLVKLSPSLSDHGETILVVEDQPATAQITRILLESWGYRVMEAHTGRDAIALFDRGQAIDLLLTDVIMPGMTGPQLAEVLTGRDPNLPVIFMSGYSSQKFEDLRAAFLPKPFNPASLSRMVRKALDINDNSGTQRSGFRPRSNQ